MLGNDDVIRVINRTALIENLLNQVIQRYCCPRKEAFTLFWSVVLNSSIMPLGPKVKVAMAIAQEIDVKLKQDPLHKLISYRNAFAHHSVDAHPTFYVGKYPEQHEMHYELHVILNSGKMQRIRRDKALKDFDNLFDQAKQSLVELINAIEANLKGGEDGTT